MDQARWQKLTLAEQMGNIGSEIGRALYWHNKNDEEQRERSASRALELIDFTIFSQRQNLGLKELTRFREVFCDLVYGKNIYKSTLEQIQNYCLQFGIAARKINNCN